MNSLSTVVSRSRFFRLCNDALPPRRWQKKQHRARRERHPAAILVVTRSTMTKRLAAATLASRLQPVCRRRAYRGPKNPLRAWGPTAPTSPARGPVGASTAGLRRAGAQIRARRSAFRRPPWSGLISDETLFGVVVGPCRARDLIRGPPHFPLKPRKSGEQAR
jgi:hypothetical protein